MSYQHAVVSMPCQLTQFISYFDGKWLSVFRPLVILFYGRNPNQYLDSVPQRVQVASSFVFLLYRNSENLVYLLTFYFFIRTYKWK